MLQPNTAYPATAYLKGYLKCRGFDVEQFDLSVELLSAVFTGEFLRKIFARYNGGGDAGIERIYNLRRNYINTVECVMKFLRGEDPSAANLICSADFLPQAGRFVEMEDIGEAFGSAGIADCAKYLATLYLEDISDFIRAVASPHFGLARYGEKIAVSAPVFAGLKAELDRPADIIEEKMLELLSSKVAEYGPTHAGFTVPFPGNLLSALRCGTFLKSSGIKVVLGGGYVTTELRSLTDTAIFDHVDYIVLDDGEIPLERILAGGELVRTFTREGKKVVYSGNDSVNVSHAERGCPDFSGLPWDKYIGLMDVANPMQSMWSDGKWNKITAAHGCYWAGCAFCDTTLDYICRYDGVYGSTLVDWMERVMEQTGQSGFHFTDEALPPRTARDMALEILRRGMKVSWWGNIRFEPHYTADVCQLMAASGCIAVSGGVETASDRLLGLMNKGVSIEQLTITLRNFCYAGIMVHTYLMYGFPTQTYQEVVDSLEVVRQLFRADLTGSAFWHRYAMTRHSPSGGDPARYGVRIKNNTVNRFANNEVDFAENRNYDINMAGMALRKAVYNYMRGSGLETPVDKWFEHRSPATSIEETLITDHLIKPDRSRMYGDNARLVWTGAEVVEIPEGLMFYGNSKEKRIKFTRGEACFILRLIEKCSDLSQKVTLGDAKEMYAGVGEAPFSYFYHSKKWDIVRSFGLLQI